MIFHYLILFLKYYFYSLFNFNYFNFSKAETDAKPNNPKKRVRGKASGKSKREWKARNWEATTGTSGEEVAEEAAEGGEEEEEQEERKA